jgi:hypothetical protein
MEGAEQGGTRQASDWRGALSLLRKGAKAWGHAKKTGRQLSFRNEPQLGGDVGEASVST